ncbi:chorismate mutase [Buchnera aphidicola]|uniref:Bifunctional chorismate mutase/prephenate dehydratase n=1 Tax=Buchnera aphidicola (Stegophylla sp.) TaxID=2315800 RepID=A0A4D6YEI3_9GAMM|nr:chorismate mutase [Buchnera aphidicola (Stegophylla sp.)]QCI26413.1 chorismate mutase [Buchnera aphidicola (Stegophylla sp.)]
MYYQKKLLTFRNKINDIDKTILRLLSDRKKIIVKIVHNKIFYNLSIKDKKREQEILEKLFKIGKKYFLSNYYIKKIFKNIIHESVKIQQKIKNKYITKNIFTTPCFTFLGPKGSYSYLATIKYAKKKFQYFNIKTQVNFQQIFQSIKNKISHFTIVPIENTYSGFINEIYSLLLLRKINIIDEVVTPIQHHLITKNITHLKNIKTIYSHPQPFEQCNKFLKTFKNLKIQYTNSTTDAIRKILTIQNNYSAAIGNKEKIKTYQLKNHKNKITNQKYNNTKFFILQNKKFKKFPNVTTKIICIINIKQYLELTNKILFLLTQNKINILKIELKSNHYKIFWENTIYLEIQKYPLSKKIKTILKKIKNIN